jgi:hypothetical protein
LYSSRDRDGRDLDLGESRIRVWLPTQTPERIRPCDQTYTKRDDRVFTREQVGRGDPDPSPIILEPNVGRTPVGVATPDRYEPGAGYNGCGHMLALHTGMNEYVLYFKLGGP